MTVELQTKETTHHAIALAWAQKFAEMLDEPVTLTVQREAIFGPTEDVYRVVRDETGTVWTAVVAGE